MDEPQHHDVGRDAQEHVNELQAQVPNEYSGHVFAMLIHRPLTIRVVDGSVRDKEYRGVDVENRHEGQIRERCRQRTPARGIKICQTNTYQVQVSETIDKHEVIMLCQI